VRVERAATRWWSSTRCLKALPLALLAGGCGEHQRALARAGDAGEHRQPALRDLDVEVLEVVHARAVHVDQIVWLSATCSAGDRVSVLVAMLIVSPSARQGRLRGLRRPRLALDLTSFEEYVWFSFVGAVAATVAVYRIGGVGRPRRQTNQRPSRISSRSGPLLRQRVDLEDLDFALDHGHVAGVAQPQPNGPGGGPGSCRSGCPSAWPSAAPRRPSRRTAAPGTAHRRRGTGHPDVVVVGEPMLGVATTLSAGAGVGTHRS
jgi:hypothetical protein